MNDWLSYKASGSAKNDPNALRHWGVKGMKWGHHNQSEQKEKQYEADKRLEAAKAILDAKKTIETDAKEMKRAQDDIGKSLASVNSLTDSYKRAYDRYISAKPEQRDALFNAMTTIYNKLKSETNNLNNLELTISNNRSNIDSKRLSLNSLGSRMSGADAVMLDEIETDNDLWYDLRDMHKKCTDAQNAASKVLSSHEANVYDKSRVFKHSFKDNSEYLEHAMTLKQLLTREGVKEFLSTNQLNRTKAWAATIETLSEAANKMVTNLNNFPKATNIKGLTESKKIVEQSSRLYKYIEDYKGELNDYTVEITEIIFNKLSEKYSDLSSVTDGLKQARDSLNEMGKVMTYTINAFKNNCDVVTSGFKIEQKALEKQRNAFKNSKLREEYQRRIDALNQSIGTVANMKAEVEGLKHSFEDDSEYLEHWGVKGMKWGHHNQQEEKQAEADARLKEAQSELQAKRFEEEAKIYRNVQFCQSEIKRLLDEISQSYAKNYEEVENKIRILDTCNEQLKTMEKYADKSSNKEKYSETIEATKKWVDGAKKIISKSCEEVIKENERTMDYLIKQRNQFKNEQIRNTYNAKILRFENEIDKLNTIKKKFS